MSGVTVELYKWEKIGSKYDWNLKGNTTTDSSGKYSFSVSAVGYYKAKFILPDGYAFSPKDIGRDSKDSDAGSDGFTNWYYVCSTDKTIDAGMYELPRASVGNFVWEDQNNNGIQDVGEPAIEGIEVKLYKCDGEFVANTTTDNNGYYIFTGLAPGSYYMEFVKPTGSVFAPQGQGSTATDSDADEFGKTDCFALISGQYYEDIDAGIYIPPEQAIPEFPTIALPIAAILGLAFIMQRRKE